MRPHEHCLKFHIAMRRLKRISRKYTAKGRNNSWRAHPLKGHPFVIPVVALLSFIFIGLAGLVFSNTQTIGASDSRIVELTIDGEERTIPTRAKTVGDLLKRLNITVNEGDIVTPKVDAPILEDNTEIKVQTARPVTIIDNGHAQTILSAHEQPRTVVKEAGITLHPEDGIETSRSAVGPTETNQKILGDQIVVDRAVPANINLYGNSIAVRTRANTVGDLLDEKDIKTLDGDTIAPSRNAKLTPNTQIFIVRNGKKVVTTEEAIPFPTVTEDDPNLAMGATVVKEAGANGKKLVTYEIELENEQEVGRRVLQEVVAAEPIRKVVTRGTKPLITGGRAEWLKAAGVSPSDYYAVDYIIGKESGWCPTKWQGEYGGCPAYHGAPTSSRVGYGLCQATPGYKMASAGDDWAVNPVTQLKWCSNYAKTRHGGWAGAYNFWIVNHWW